MSCPRLGDGGGGVSGCLNPKSGVWCQDTVQLQAQRIIVNLFTGIRDAKLIEANGATPEKFRGGTGLGGHGLGGLGSGWYAFSGFEDQRDVETDEVFVQELSQAKRFASAFLRMSWSVL